MRHFLLLFDVVQRTLITREERLGRGSRGGECDMSDLQEESVTECADLMVFEGRTDGWAKRG